jgi:hypothetical protein
LLSDLVNSGILRVDADRRYFFLHLTIHEFLTACALAEKAEEQGWEAVASLVERKAWLLTWQEVIVLLAGTLTDPTLDTWTDPALLLSLLARKQEDDYFRHRLALAALCLPELDPTKRNAPSAIVAVDRITTATFSLWQQLTKYRIDTVAQYLTRAIPGLGQVNGRVNGVPLLEWVRRRMWVPDLAEQEIAVNAVRSLGRVAATPPILTALAELLQAPDWVMCQTAEEAVVVLGIAAATPTFLTALAGLLQAPERERCWAAARVMATMMEQGVRIFEDGHGRWRGQTVPELCV